MSTEQQTRRWSTDLSDSLLEHTFKAFKPNLAAEGRGTRHGPRKSEREIRCGSALRLVIFMVGYNEDKIDARSTKSSEAFRPISRWTGRTLSGTNPRLFLVKPTKVVVSARGFHVLEMDQSYAVWYQFYEDSPSNHRRGQRIIPMANSILQSVPLLSSLVMEGIRETDRIVSQDGFVSLER